jgi:hypothetical protein
VNVSVFVQKINSIWTDTNNNNNNPTTAQQQQTMVRGTITTTAAALEQTGHHHHSICILIPEDNPFIWEFTLPDLVDTRGSSSSSNNNNNIEEEEEAYVFSVLINDNYEKNYSRNTAAAAARLERMSWFVHNSPLGSGLQFIHVYGNESVFATLFSAGSIHGCTYYFAIGGHIRFVSSGWAVSMVSALQTSDFTPNFGVVIPSASGNLDVRIYKDK